MQRTKQKKKSAAFEKPRRRFDCLHQANVLLFSGPFSEIAVLKVQNPFFFFAVGENLRFTQTCFPNLCNSAISIIIAKPYPKYKRSRANRFGRL